MPATSRLRVVIVGASTLLAKELHEVLEASRLAAAEISLLDDEVADGLLTEAGGEPVVIRGINQDSFDGARFAFFTGDAALTQRHWEQAHCAGSVIIDLTGALAAVPSAALRITSFRKGESPATSSGPGEILLAASTPAIVASTLAAALAPLGALGLAITFFQPVSERGRAGIDELESQTVNLLSLQAIPQQVFDIQVAFNLLRSFGAECREPLDHARARIADEVARALNSRAPVPAVQLIHAPVFYGSMFVASLTLDTPQGESALDDALAKAGCLVGRPGELGPDNVGIAGEDRIAVAHAERDPNLRTSYWLWGAADNLRLAARNAVSLAEQLLPVS